MPVLEASGIVPTIDRPEILGCTLKSLQQQQWLPRELIIVDASRDNRTCDLIASLAPDFAEKGCHLLWQRALLPGAAAQRNEGVVTASQPIIWFFDDDIRFEPHCVERLWAALQSDEKLGGVSAMIINQRYQPPGWISRLAFRLMDGRADAPYAGRVLGPAVNLLPEDSEDLPDVVPVEWLNTTCTLYRGGALPQPPFPHNFRGYSLMEDLALSLKVARKSRLANARTARIYHDSQPGCHKNEPVTTSRMEFVNRHYVMTKVLGKCGLKDYARFALWELFQLTSCAINERGGIGFWWQLRGKIQGLCNILAERVRLDHQ
jgi:glycosyltransferase involved in cell wall biosynthesis